MNANVLVAKRECLFPGLFISKFNYIQYRESQINSQFTWTWGAWGGGSKSQKTCTVSTLFLDGPLIDTM